MCRSYLNIRNEDKKMKRDIKKKLPLSSKESGVVLLSCLVFLLILLGIVRFVMTSSRLEERKAGVDYEMVTARQSAKSAIRYAEKYILEQGLSFCKKSGGAGSTDDSCEEKNPAEMANALWKLKDNDLKTALDKIGQGNFLEQGIYTYSYVKNSYSSCRPFLDLC